MSFHDLPDDWPHRPLTDPDLVRDVLDLVVSEEHREMGGLAILLCDGRRRLRHPCFVATPVPEPTPEQRRQVLESYVTCLGQGAVPGRRPAPAAVLLAIARQRNPTPQPSDLLWRAAAVAACGDRVLLLGVHLVTREGFGIVPAPIRAA